VGAIITGPGAIVASGGTFDVTFTGTGGDGAKART
jgi:hypothetical protein